MNSAMQILLQNEKCNLKEVDAKIVLYKDELNHFPEDYVEIKKNTLTGIHTVSEIHRDEKQIKFQTKEESLAEAYAIILYKKLFDNIGNQSQAREIRNYVKLGNIEKALECITKRFSDCIFSIGKEKYMRISFLQIGDKIEIKFNGSYIAESASLPRGYVVLNNYCEKLQYITSYYEENKSQFRDIVDNKQVFSWYILG